jgi:hypothetical protein
MQAGFIRYLIALGNQIIADPVEYRMAVRLESSAPVELSHEHDQAGQKTLSATRLIERISDPVFLWRGVRRSLRGEGFIVLTLRDQYLSLCT